MNNRNTQLIETAETAEIIVPSGARVATWNHVGTPIIKGSSNIKEALVEAGLDYKVVKRPDYTRHNGRYEKRPGYFWTMKKGSDVYYSHVTASYEIVQNMDAFDFLSYFDGELTIERAGETADGMVFVIGSLPSVKILGDEFTPYLIFINGFGRYSLRACICSLRIVCENQIALSLAKSKSSITMMHTKNVHKKIQEAGILTQAGYDYMRELSAEAERYALVKINARQLAQMTEALIPVKNTTEAGIARVMKKRQEFSEVFADCYNAEDNQNFRGSAWGVINALSDFYTRNPGSKNPEIGFKNATFTTGENRLLTAVKILNDIIQ